MIYHSDDYASTMGHSAKDGMGEYEELCSAVVLRAVDDWRWAVRKLWLDPDNLEAERLRKDCEQFFLSGWFGVWTDLDGGWLLRKLKGEMAA